MSPKMLIKPFRSIESAATATHNWRRRQILRAGASTLVLGLVAAPRLAWASSVLGVRVWPARDYTRVTIESDQPLENEQHLLQGPDRLVVDLNGLDLDRPRGLRICNCSARFPALDQAALRKSPDRGHDPAPPQTSRAKVMPARPPGKVNATRPKSDRDRLRSAMTRSASKPACRHDSFVSNYLRG